MSWDKLKKTVNVEKSVRQILQIIKKPHTVYGHGLVSQKELRQVEQRLQRIETDLRRIKDKLDMLDNMDRLNEI